MAKKKTTARAEQPVRILHLSDFHLSQRRRWDQDPVLNALSEAIGDLVSQGLAPDVVAITGDVADWGLPAEYEQAAEWIEAGLMKHLPDGFPRQRILLVPGNHDVSRAAVKNAAKALQNSLLHQSPREAQDAIAAVLSDPDERDVLLKRHTAYLDFASSFRPADEGKDVPWWSRSMSLHGRTINFAGLCSSWMSCGDDDHGHLLVGRWQINQLFADSGRADAIVVLVHHPWSFLAEFDGGEVEATVQRRADLVLRGHLHRQKSRTIFDPDDLCLELAAGSIYDGSQHPNAFQLVELDPSTKGVRVHYWLWRGGRWIADRNAYQNAPVGVAEFSLAPPSPNDKPSTPRPARQPATVSAAKYLRQLAELTAYIDIRGLQVGSGRAMRFGIDELYIPLTTREPVPQREAHNAAADGLAELHGRSDSVSLDEALAHRRLAIVGDPGSGKTTFLRRIAHLLCVGRSEGEDADGEELGLEGDRLPLLVRVAQLLEHIQACRNQNRAGMPTTASSPAWLAHFLATQSRESAWGLDEAFFREQFEKGQAVVLLDGLDETAGEQDRLAAARLVEAAAAAFDGCRFVLTSRPAAYRGQAVLADFAGVHIEPIEDAAMETFLGHWCDHLFPDSPGQAARHLAELLDALRSRIEIRRLARNPVMLTALAVVHWNEKRLPEQRADLYESIINWLARARPRRNRPTPERCIGILQNLALAMQDHPEGRRVQVTRHWAATQIAPAWREVDEEDRLATAERFLAQEELDSGIVVARGDEVCFWHLTFQEYLAARALAARSDRVVRQTLYSQPKLYQPEWKEVVLLLGGVLHGLGIEKADGLFEAVLDQLGQHPTLAEQARCVGLLGAVARDLAPVHYHVGDPRYDRMLTAVLDLFDAEKAKSVPIDEAIAAAEALGQADDPRFARDRQDDLWVTIPAGQFWMGAATKGQRNVDTEAHEWEAPVHSVYLDEFRITRFPVTVGQFKLFIEQGGYEQEQHWSAGGFGQFSRPDEWDEQLQFPNRPVVGVSWFEASAFAAWSGAALPTEAQWERAARGTTARKYPWGHDNPDPRRLNYERNVGRPTPVGVYPAGATPEGICDVAGNVWEWCHDWYGGFKADDARNPTGPAEGPRRVVRGGGWDNYARDCRSSYRYRFEPTGRNYNLGFRLVVLFGGQDS